MMPDENDVEDIELYEVDEEIGNWMPTGWKNRKQKTKVYVHRIAEVKADKLTRTSAMKFNAANVRMPLASAAGGEQNEQLGGAG